MCTRDALRAVTGRRNFGMTSCACAGKTRADCATIPKARALPKGMMDGAAPR
jgi:hypothetical protein